MVKVVAKGRTETAREALSRVRAQFAQLAACYTELGQYSAAMGARRVAIELTRFIEDPEVAEFEWPPRVVQIAAHKVLARVG